MTQDAPASDHITIADIDVTALLDARAPREPAYRLESETFAEVAETFADAPERVTRALADAALRLTGAHSAGVSLEDRANGERVFRWVATAGDFERYSGGTMPREFSPCGEVLRRNAPVLMRDPIRLYQYMTHLDPPVREVLLVPFHRNGTPVGTVWVVSHDEEKVFDREDLRVIRGVTRFAAAAVQTVGLVGALRVDNDAKSSALDHQRRELADARTELSQLQRWLAQSPGFFAYLAGPNHVFEIANEACCQVAGSHDLVGRALADALPELRARGLPELLDRVYQTGEPHIGRESPVWFHGRDESELPTFLDFVYQPVCDHSGAVQGILVQGHECTERKLTMDLLRETDQRKDEFLAVLAHEMRTPLSAIGLSAELIKGADTGSDLVRTRAAVIERQLAQLGALISDITDVVGIRSGKVTLHTEPLIAQDLLGRVLEACSPHATAKQQRLEIDAPEDPLWFDGDLLRLNQVFTNLVNNAVKYTPAGGVVQVALAAHDGELEFRVTDSGIGIDRELLPRVFDMFMQVHPGEGSRSGGLGIGLALVRQFVQMHGGSVRAESEGEGRGSTFIVRLPRADPQRFAAVRRAT